ncbi:hypothetical protein GHK48_27910 [Sinorhizobium fredii]|uniref:Uncharacterized protein n=1 Tax=Rhizobium fredii TaxID=380 RepID=A0A844AJ28_RHIFR|nr:hypothetical protein [Sinorhizobium fredii]MQX11968.1 hypothetical protein [Sinorhizobium fredii]UTY51517.1 hypothetical protein EPK84_24885 [Sinorhizobium fredii]
MRAAVATVTDRSATNPAVRDGTRGSTPAANREALSFQGATVQIGIGLSRSYVIPSGSRTSNRRR